MKDFAKILGINIYIFLILLFSPALLLKIYGFTRAKFVNTLNLTKDKRSLYPVYSDKDFSIKLLNEFKKFSTEYKSYIGWKLNKANFDYTTVHGQYNSRKSKGEEIDDSVWFFGGSTIWGFGASDFQTIPSHFNSITERSVFNFGEIGWNSRQSLNQLITALGDHHKPSVIIFYDGFNDIIQQCRNEIHSIPAHGREEYLKNIITSKNSSFRRKIVRFIYEPYKPIVKKFKTNSNLTNSSLYDCHLNQNKARLIAQHLVKTWYTAFIISSENQIPFYAILQPHLFTTYTNFEYMDEEFKQTLPEYERQLSVVYPLIIKEMKKECDKKINFCDSFKDGTNWLDNQKNIFLDYCHINSRGNYVVAKKIADLIK